MLVLLDLGNAVLTFYGILLLIPVVVFLILMVAGCRVVEEETRMIVERWGKFHRVCMPGFNYVVPVAERTREIKWRSTFPRVVRSGYNTTKQVSEVKQITTDRIDLRCNVMDFPTQPIITRDNVEIQVHPMILYKLVDPMRVAYETYDLSHAVEKLVQTNLRAIIGDMGMDDTLASREEINRSLKTKIKKTCHNWGLEVQGVELLEISPSREVQKSMHMQLIAERNRRALIVAADGSRLQKKMGAEGNCESKKAISKGTQRKTEIIAKGKSDARKLIADANAKAIKIVGDVVSKHGKMATQYMVALKYIETFENIVTYAKRRHVYFPFESDLVGDLHSKQKRS